MESGEWFAVMAGMKEMLLLSVVNLNRKHLVCELNSILLYLVCCLVISNQ